jgi:shikimate dehydrogenase
VVFGEPRPLLRDQVGGAGSARRCAVLGSPIGHSLSPALHRAAYAHLDLDWTYDAIDVDEAGLPGFLAGLDAGWRGLSLTMPLKRAVLPLLDDVEPLASRVGAANTVVLDAAPAAGDGSERHHVRRKGSNSDVPGLVAALTERGVRVSAAARVLILGAGATAASAVAAIADLAPAGLRVQVVLAVREPARAAPLVALAAGFGLAVQVTGLASLTRGTADPGGAFELVVSTVPAGALGPEAADAVVRTVLGDGAVCDVVYDGWPTPLARSAAAAGLRVVSGTDLLVHQARGQVLAFTGGPVPVEVLRGALPDRLREPLDDLTHHSSM